MKSLDLYDMQILLDDYYQLRTEYKPKPMKTIFGAVSLSL